jgi:cation:H+ antiporter
MWSDVALLLTGLVLLTAGAEALVRGSSALARRLGLTPLVVGLTVVAFGTSSPELVVSLEAALNSQGDLALGNVVGSNMFNVGVILGLTALLCPIAVSLPVIRFDTPVMIAVSLAGVGLIALGHVPRALGLLLVAALAAYTAFNIRAAKRQARAESAARAQPAATTSGSVSLELLFVAGGLGFLVLGSHLLITSAVAISRALNVSEAVIGLTVVAAGTSMPELATSVAAAVRRHPDIAVGNVVGSNIFNILGILGTAAMVQPIAAPGIGMRDAWVMLAFALAVLPLFWTGRRLLRWEGVLLLAGYGVYLWVLWPSK